MDLRIASFDQDEWKSVHQPPGPGGYWEEVVKPSRQLGGFMTQFTCHLPPGRQKWLNQNKKLLCTSLSRIVS